MHRDLIDGGHASNQFAGHHQPQHNVVIGGVYGVSSRVTIDLRSPPPRASNPASGRETSHVMSVRATPGESRRSSLSSVNEETDDAKSTVDSLYSTQPTGCVSPSEIPDSPCQTMPPSPRSKRRAEPVENNLEDDEKPRNFATDDDIVSDRSQRNVTGVAVSAMQHINGQPSSSALKDEEEPARPPPTTNNSAGASEPQSRAEFDVDSVSLQVKY